MRTKEKLIKLVKPWKVKEPGFLPLEKWYDLAPDATVEAKNVFGADTFGGFLEK